MNNPKISVIIPVYNVEQYLNRCLDSIVNQTLKEIEIICVNDGSTDNSLSILKEYASKDNRIKIIDKENEGLGYTRKVGLDNATGKYILFCDSDDYYSELTAFEKLFNYAIKINSDITAFDFYHCLNSKVKRIIPFIPNSPDKKIFTYKDIQNINSINTSSCIRLYSKSFLDSNNDWYFPKKTFYEDTPFHFQTLFRANFSYIKEPFYVYAIRENSITTKLKTNKNFVDVYTTTKVAFDFVNNLNIDNKKEIFNQLLLYFLNKLKIRLDNAFLITQNAEYIINSIKLFDISNYDIDKLVYETINRKLFFVYKAIKKFTPEQFRDYINKKQAKEQKIKIQEQNRKIQEQNQKIQEKTKKIQEQNRKIQEQNKKIQEQNKKIQEQNKKAQEQNRKLREENRKVQDLIIKRLQNSWSYKIGRLITYPLSIPFEFYHFITDYNLIKKSDLFDSEYYLAENEDVKKSKIDPIKHYLKFGWKEGRNPSSEFNGNEYLNKRPDVRVAGLCPLVHYLKFGKNEQ